MLLAITLRSTSARADDVEDQIQPTFGTYSRFNRALYQKLNQLSHSLLILLKMRNSGYCLWDSWADA